MILYKRSIFWIVVMFFVSGSKAFACTPGMDFVPWFNETYTVLNVDLPAGVEAQTDADTGEAYLRNTSDTPLYIVEPNKTIWDYFPIKYSSVMTLNKRFWDNFTMKPLGPPLKYITKWKLVSGQLFQWNDRVKKWNKITLDHLKINKEFLHTYGLGNYYQYMAPRPENITVPDSDHFMILSWTDGKEIPLQIESAYSLNENYYPPRPNNVCEGRYY